MLEDAKGGVLSRLIEAYPKAGEEFDVVLEKGERLRFRGPTSASELHRVREAAAATVERLKAGRVPEPMKAWLTGDDATYFYAAVLGRLSVSSFLSGSDEDQGPVPEDGWLQIAAEAPTLFDTVRRAVDDRLTVLAATAAAASVEEKKSDSRTTGSPGTASS